MTEQQLLTYRAIDGHVTSTLWRNTFLLIGLNAFDASTNNDYSDSHPAYCPAQTCSDPTDCITSSLRCETITFPAMRHSTSPTPIGLSPGFLSRGINRFPRKASKDVD